MSLAIRAITRLQDADDVDFSTPPSSGQALVYDGVLAKWQPGSAGVTDHGALTGLGDDDHSIYALADKSRPATWVSAGDLAARSLADLGTRAHSDLTGLTTGDPHTQYPVLAPAASARNLITSQGEAVIPVQVRAHASQTANLQQWQNSAGTTLAYVSKDGYVYGTRLYVGSGGSYMQGGGAPNLDIRPGDGYSAVSIIGGGGPRVQIPYGTVFTGTNQGYSVLAYAGAATNNVLWGVGAAGQSAHLLLLQSSTSAEQFGIGPTGQIRTNQSAANTNTPSGATARQLPLYDAAGSLLGYVPVYASPW